MGLEVGQTTLSTDKVKNEWSYTCTFWHVFLLFTGTTYLLLYHVQAFCGQIFHLSISLPYFFVSYFLILLAFLFYTCNSKHLSWHNLSYSYWILCRCKRKDTDEEQEATPVGRIHLTSGRSSEGDVIRIESISFLCFKFNRKCFSSLTQGSFPRVINPSAPPPPLSL